MGEWSESPGKNDFFSGVCLKSSYLPFLKQETIFLKNFCLKENPELYISNPHSSDSLCKGKNVFKGD